MERELKRLENRKALTTPAGGSDLSGSIKPHMIFKLFRALKENASLRAEAEQLRATIKKQNELNVELTKRIEGLKNRNGYLERIHKNKIESYEIKKQNTSEDKEGFKKISLIKNIEQPMEDERFEINQHQQGWIKKSRGV